MRYRDFVKELELLKEFIHFRINYTWGRDWSMLSNQFNIVDGRLKIITFTNFESFLLAKGQWTYEEYVIYYLNPRLEKEGSKHRVKYIYNDNYIPSYKK